VISHFNKTAYLLLLIKLNKLKIVAVYNVNPIIMRISTCFLFVIFLLSSCTVTNNLYVNDPVSVQKDNADSYVGIGTGVKASIDSVSANGDIAFSNELTMAPNLCFGSQIGLIHNLDLRAAVHLPYILGGFGARLGPQYTFFSKESKFNMAIGSDLGFVIAKDSIKIFGTTSALNIHANGAINADFFIPLSFNLNENSRIIITPRYSFNTIYIRHNTGEKESFKFSPHIPSLALGLRLDRLYIEASAFRFRNEYYPNFGLIYIFKGNSSDGVELEL